MSLSVFNANTLPSACYCMSVKVSGFLFLFLVYFSGVGLLKSTSVKEEPKYDSLNPAPKVDDPNDDKEDTTLLPGEKEVSPVGE